MGSLGWLSLCPLHPHPTPWGPTRWPRGTGRRACRPPAPRAWRAGRPRPGASAAPRAAAPLPARAGHAAAAPSGSPSGNPSGSPALAVRSFPRCKWTVGPRGSGGCKEAEGLPGPESEETMCQEEGRPRRRGGDATAAGSGCGRGVEASCCRVGGRRREPDLNVPPLKGQAARSSPPPTLLFSSRLTCQCGSCEPTRHWAPSQMQQCLCSVRILSHLLHWEPKGRGVSGLSPCGQRVPPQVSSRQDKGSPCTHTCMLFCSHAPHAGRCIVPVPMPSPPRNTCVRICSQKQGAITRAQAHAQLPQGLSCLRADRGIQHLCLLITGTSWNLNSCVYL